MAKLTARKPLLTLLALALGATATFFVVRSVIKAFQTSFSWQQVQWGYIGMAVAVGILGLMVAPLLWVRLLKICWPPESPEPEFAQLHLLYSRSWLARYIPGAVWLVGGRALLAARMNMPSRPLYWSLAIETLFRQANVGMVGVGAILASTTNATIGIAVAIVGAVAISIGMAWGLQIVSRSRPPGVSSHGFLASFRARLAGVDLPPFGQRALVTTSWVFFGHALLGALFVGLLSVGILGLSLTDALMIGGLAGLASVLGLLLVWSPVGFGARDGIALAIFTPVVGLESAGILVVGVRIITILVDVSFVVISELLTLRFRSPSQHSLSSSS